MVDTPACTAHPDRAYPDLLGPDGFFLESPHAFPRPDPELTFKFTTMTPTPELVTSLCAGEQYAITLTFEDLSLALMSATEGVFEHATPGCPNRIDMGGSRRDHAAYSLVANYTASCNPTGPAFFRVTVAPIGYLAYWRTNNLTIEVDTDCMAPECANIKPEPVVISSPPPPAVKPSPKKSKKSPPPPHKKLKLKKSPPPRRPPPPKKGKQGKKATATRRMT
ncbi:hypothetical protein HYH03_012635 [Edaphochlamys debaryana]|uniref:Uncharacterized protein n=1 Tax=Edaphochlamys debaryana TaxID=47281 RepID=A0A835XPR0_9CHLO|nr:hypothetical protein HYH03_012635 [Edaphochlamys debaryana]|eukprot:KAG2488837.1 hypothetical protein HYH03_012635 [Edaphochlamys debaryana]